MNLLKENNFLFLAINQIVSIFTYFIKITHDILNKIKHFLKKVAQYTYLLNLRISIKALHSI